MGTPPGEDGSADLQYVLAAARDIGRRITGYSIIVDKSTVPVGTADKVRAAIRDELGKRGLDIPVDVVSNPEFLKEGAAVEDFMKPDRVVVGTDSEQARQVMHDLYAPFMRTHERLLFMGIKEAELTKYAANAMLATKISFMNEISNSATAWAWTWKACVRASVRIRASAIPSSIPAPATAARAFPKDVKALVRMAHEQNFDPLVLNAVETRNEAQKYVLSGKIIKRFGTDLRNHAFGLWGLAFKPGTDDMREAPSRVLLEELLGRGAHVKAYDPVAMPVAQPNYRPSGLAVAGLNSCRSNTTHCQGRTR